MRFAMEKLLSLRLMEAKDLRAPPNETLRS